jgi:hypothetical protein
MAHSGHSSQELFQSGWLGVKSFERVGATFPDLVLRESSSERRCEVAPKWIEPTVGHLKDTADVGWLAFVEKEIRDRGVVVPTVAAFEEFQGYESVEEISRRSRMEPEASLQRIEIFRVFAQFRKHFHLDSAQQCFRRPESEAHLQNVIRP